MLTIGSLFSGIGGLELGLERAGLGPVVWQCESDPYRVDRIRCLGNAVVPLVAETVGRLIVSYAA